MQRKCRCNSSSIVDFVYSSLLKYDISSWYYLSKNNVYKCGIASEGKCDGGIIIILGFFWSIMEILTYIAIPRDGNGGHWFWEAE